MQWQLCSAVLPSVSLSVGCLALRWCLNTVPIDSFSLGPFVVTCSAMDLYTVDYSAQREHCPARSSGQVAKQARGARDGIFESFALIQGKASQLSTQALVERQSMSSVQRNSGERACKDPTSCPQHNQFSQNAFVAVLLIDDPRTCVLVAAL